LKDQFPGYYRRSEEEIERIWDDGLFVLDANVLLNLYRYSEGTREELLGVLRGVKDRLWIPYQVAEEFLRNRQTVIGDRKNAYSAVKKSLSSARKDVESKMGEMHKDPGIIEAKDLRKKVEESFGKLVAEAEGLEKRAALQSIRETNSPDDDEIWRAIEEILWDRVGEGLSSYRTEQVLGIGPRRYESMVPPGFKDHNDRSKPGDRQFGDLILWFETLDKAKETGRPVLFVTDDRKEDWWSRSGKEIYPHPELGNEMHREAGVFFHMLMPLDFMKWAGPKLNQEISDEAAGEIEELWSLEEPDEIVDVDLFNLLFHEDYGQVLGVDDLLQTTEDAESSSGDDTDRVIRRAERLERLMKQNPDEYHRKVQRMERLSRERLEDPAEYIRRLERRLRMLER